MRPPLSLPRGPRNTRINNMTSAERRIALIRLLADIDQRIAEAETSSAASLLTTDERGFIAEQLAYRRNAMIRIEKLLTEVG